MPSKRHFNQLKLAETLAVKVYKKRKFEASLIINLQPEIEDDKLNMADKSNTKVKSEIWFQNNSVNESNLDIEKGEDRDKNKLDLEVEKSGAINPKVCKEIK